MKKSITILLSVVALCVIAGTNNVTVRIDLTDVQSDQLRFLKRYFGSTNTLKDFATNVVAISWTPAAQSALDARNWRLMQTVSSVLAQSDDTVTSLENALGLPPLTNSVPLAP